MGGYSHAGSEKQLHANHLNQATLVELHQTASAASCAVVVSSRSGQVHPVVQRQRKSGLRVHEMHMLHMYAKLLQGLVVL